MSDSLYEPKVYQRQGGDATVLKSGGKIVVMSGGAITSSGETKASAIADFTSSANMSAAQIAKLNNVLAAMRNIGVLATS